VVLAEDLGELVLGQHETLVVRVQETVRDRLPRAHSREV
jgi:hypothetical protein